MRVALREELYTGDWSDDPISKLIGLSNEEGVWGLRAREKVQGLSEDLEWKEELDIESRAILEKKGRMLGISIDDDTSEAFRIWYHGGVGNGTILASWVSPP